MTEKEVGILLEDRRLVIPEKVYLLLEDVAAKERKKTDNPVIKAMITPKSVAQKILAVSVEPKRKPLKLCGDAETKAGAKA